MSGELAIQALLVADSTYLSLIGSGTKVFYDEVDQTTKLPFSVVYCDSVEPNDTKDGVSTLDFDLIYVTHFHSSKKVLSQIANAARTALDRKSGTYNTVPVESVRFITQRSNTEQLVNKTTHTIEQLYQVMTRPIPVVGAGFEYTLDFSFQL